MAESLTLDSKRFEAPHETSFLSSSREFGIKDSAITLSLGRALARLQSFHDPLLLTAIGRGPFSTQSLEKENGPLEEVEKRLLSGAPAIKNPGRTSCKRSGTGSPGTTV